MNGRYVRLVRRSLVRRSLVRRSLVRRSLVLASRFVRRVCVCVFRERRIVRLSRRVFRRVRVQCPVVVAVLLRRRGRRRRRLFRDLGLDDHVVVGGARAHRRHPRRNPGGASLRLDPDLLRWGPIVSVGVVVVNRFRLPGVRASRGGDGGEGSQQEHEDRPAGTRGATARHRRSKTPPVCRARLLVSRRGVAQISNTRLGTRPEPVSSETASFLARDGNCDRHCRSAVSPRWWCPRRRRRARRRFGRRHRRVSPRVPARRARGAGAPYPSPSTGVHFAPPRVGASWSFARRRTSRGATRATRAIPRRPPPARTPAGGRARTPPPRSRWPPSATATTTPSASRMRRAR